MKNSIFIDVDSDRDQPIIIGKPDEIKAPENAEEAAVMIISDISCVCEALCTLIHMADQNNYGKKAELVAASIKYLNDLLIDTPTDNEKI
jgi:hypothetical protein